MTPTRQSWYISCTTPRRQGSKLWAQLSVYLPIPQISVCLSVWLTYVQKLFILSTSQFACLLLRAQGSAVSNLMWFGHSMCSIFINFDETGDRCSVQQQLGPVNTSDVLHRDKSVFVTIRHIHQSPTNHSPAQILRTASSFTELWTNRQTASCSSGGAASGFCVPDPAACLYLLSLHYCRSLEFQKGSWNQPHHRPSKQTIPNRHF